MKKCFKDIWLWLMSMISFLCSVAALCRTFCRTELQFDYIGVVVGILSLLVTLLIGWNIFYALELKKELKDYANTIKYDLMNRIKRHEELNNKDFASIISTIERAEKFSMKVDDTLIELMKWQKEKEGKK